MTLPELKDQVAKYQYMEDTNIIDVCLASIISTRLKLGDPIWLIVIGASSGGKSQILRPMALTDKEFIHRVDDLTENTFLSGGNIGGGADPSLLHRIGPRGMLVISDLTVLFSKSAETMATILSQFRMIYDGEMVKHVGNKPEPLKWEGSLGVLAGSTPSIYRHFQEVADMGERFIHYRFKDFDPKKATELALDRDIFGKELDAVLASLYTDYIKDVVTNADISKAIITRETKQRIIAVACLAEKIRTPVVTDRMGKVTHLPISAMPMRVALQLIPLAKALIIMRGRELDENDMKILDWCAYSLANEEKRMVLSIFGAIAFGNKLSTQNVADELSLDTTITGYILQNLAAVGILTRSGSQGVLIWNMSHEDEWSAVRRIEGIVDVIEVEQRAMTMEEEVAADWT